VFTEFFNRQNLSAERHRTGRALLLADLLMAVALGVDAIVVRVWPLTAVMTMALAIGVALAALVLEPATTKGALEDA
jgi:hypothetical protein